MLVNLNEVLPQASAGGYAVGAFNGYNLVTFQGTIEAAAEVDAPVIVAFGAKYLNNMDFDTAYAIVNTLANKVNIPVVLHLDHCSNIEKIEAAIKAGFTSVMYDGSKLSYEENLKNTSKIVAFAHKHGVSVEAELGSIAAGENSHEGSVDDEELFTDPDVAEDFVNRTGVDALAVSIGTVHGVYQGEPNLRLDILEAIKEAVDIPLVLHGGSGLSQEEMKACIERGITKVNVNTEISNHTVSSTKGLLANEEPHFSELTLAQKDFVEDIVEKYIKYFNA